MRRVQSSLRLEQERERAGQDVDDQEAEEEEDGAFDVCGRPDLRKVRDFLAERPQNQRAEEHQVDDRRNQRQSELEDENVGQRDPAERAVFRTEERVAVFPESLQRAEGPAEALANELAGGFGGFGPGDGFFVVADAPAEAADRDGEVGVFGDGVGGDAAGGGDGFFAPSAERAGNDRDAIQKIERALLHILAGDVFERLPAREPARAIADFHVAGDGAEFGIGEVAHEFADGVGLDFGVGVDGDDDFGVGFGHRVAERSGFAAIDLMNDADARFCAEVRVEKFAGAIGGAVVNDDDMEIWRVGGEDRGNSLHDRRILRCARERAR